MKSHSTTWRAAIPAIDATDAMAVMTVKVMRAVIAPVLSSMFSRHFCNQTTQHDMFEMCWEHSLATLQDKFGSTLASSGGVQSDFVTGQPVGSKAD